MAWRIEFERAAARELDNRHCERSEAIGPQSAARILRFLRDRVAPLEDARSIGQALKGDRFGEFWRYRIGDYRVIVRIEDADALILVLRVGHRREVYR
jgi:mRNA interferase RelE/StbE